MVPRFIKVFKDNKTRDRGFIAVDAICSVFENKENHNISIMTMDGFWYDVDDDIDELFDLVTGKDKKNEQSSNEPVNQKKEYFRRKKMMSPPVAIEKAQVNHEDFRKGINDCPHSNNGDDLDIFRPVMRVVNGKKPDVSRNRIKRNLPAGAGEGQYDLNPKVETPQLGEGL